MRHNVTAVCLALALCAFVGALACDNPVTHSSEPTMYTLWGRVTEEGFPVPGATVMVTASWGSNSKQTDSNGDYSGLKASGNVTLRVEKEGFTAQVKQLTVGENQVVNFELQRVNTPGDPQGMYRLIFTAAPSCTMLPSDAKQRNYSALIDRTGDDLQVTLGGGTFSQNKFAGTRDGSTVRFTIGEDEVGERLPSERVLSYGGTATGTITDSTIVTTFDGTVRIYDTSEWVPVLRAECAAKDHRMEFVR